MSLNSHQAYAIKPTLYYEESRPEMVKYIPSGARTILDIGCGAGGFACTLKKTHADLELWGIEMMPEAAAIADNRLTKVLIGTFDQNLDSLPKNYFDAIIFNDVLEHLEDPNAALKATLSLLTSKGVIVASIPNIRFIDTVWGLLWNGEWEYMDWGILDRTHLRFFTKSSILKMFMDCGFSINCIEGINPKRLGTVIGLANKLLLNRFSEMRFQQFAIVAKKQC